jgi:hypothetical protein
MSGAIGALPYYLYLSATSQLPLSGRTSSSGARLQDPQHTAGARALPFPVREKQCLRWWVAHTGDASGLGTPVVFSDFLPLE